MKPKLSSRNVLLFFLLALFSIGLVQPVFTPSSRNFNIELIKPEHKISQVQHVSIKYPQKYHNYSELTDELKYLNETNPDLVDLISIGKSWENRDIWLLKITDENAKKTDIMYVAYHHSREMISDEVLLRFCFWLINNYDTNESVRELLQHKAVYAIVALNPDALDYVEGLPWIRKNIRPIDDDHDGVADEDSPDDVNGDGFISRYAEWDQTTGEVKIWYEGIDNDGDGKVNEDWIGGVDLNRNYDYHFKDPSCDTGNTNDTTSFTYPGPYAFSEPETQALRDLALEHNFTNAISYHSGTNATLFPWGWTNEKPPDAALFDTLQIDMMGFLPSSYIGKGAVDYTSAGTWDDWMYGVRHSIPMTVEVYGNPYMYANKYGHQEHLVSTVYEFKFIKEYFNPPEARIDALSDVIHPLNYYWLKIAPGIKLTVSPVEVSAFEGNTFGITSKIENIGTRLNTTDKPEIHLEIPKNIVLLSGMPYSKILGPLESVDNTFQFRVTKAGTYLINITVSSGWAGSDSITVRVDCQVYVSDYSLLIGLSLIGAASAVLILGYFWLSKSNN